MLPKENRSTRNDIQQIFKSGGFVNSYYLTFKFIKISSKEKKISFIAPKTIFKKASLRNALRRRGYTALKKYFVQFPAGVVGVLVFKKNIDSVSEIENEIKNILNKIN